jgi:glycosyltransferase involved in cell wall biosynthesis
MSDAHTTDLHHVAADIDVLIPTRNRPVELATTLAGVAAQTGPILRVVVSDQSDDTPSFATPSATTLVRALRRRGTVVELLRNPTRRGIAEQRAFLLAKATADAVLYLDDDVWLEPGVLDRLHRALTELRCGFVAAAMQGLSHLDDRRPHEWRPFEAWQGPVRPETVAKDGPEWSRWTLHNAANGVHLAERLGLDTGPLPEPERWVAYKIAWAAGCVLFDRSALLDAGGFDFWRELPADGHGEDVLSQQRVMARHGGAGVLPSGAYHQESPTTLPVRSASAVDVLRAAQLEAPKP